MNISTTILKCVNNSKFVKRNITDYYKLTSGVKRIWLSEKLNVTPDINNVYEITTKSGKVLEGLIIDCGRDERGFFIVFSVMDWWKHERLIIPTGLCTIREVFVPEEIEGSREIMSCFRGLWPFFNGAELSVAQKVNKLTFCFKGGSVLFYAVELKLENVKSQSFVGEECDSIYYFERAKITDVKIRKTEEGTYKVILTSFYTEHIPSEESHQEGDPLIIEVKEHSNVGIIECESLSVIYYNEFHKILEEKGIRYTQLYDAHDKEGLDAEKLRSKWLEVFGACIDTSDIYIEQFLWHLLSFEKVKAIQGKEAQEKLKAADKGKVYMFLNEGELSYGLENAHGLTSEDIRFFQDVYIVDEAFTWTFVSTHEDGWCGPYFYKIWGEV